VAAALDAQKWPEEIVVLAEMTTILIVCVDTKKRQQSGQKKSAGCSTNGRPAQSLAGEAARRSQRRNIAARSSTFRLGESIRSRRNINGVHWPGWMTSKEPREFHSRK